MSKQSLLLRQKQQLEHEKDLCYKEIEYKRNMFDKQFETLYPYSKDFIFIYDITNVGFYFGEISCEYRGDSYTISNELFELSEKLEDTDAFDLTSPMFIKMYNILVALYHEICGQEFTVITNHRLTTNEIINKVKVLTKHFVQKGQNASTELTYSIQRLNLLLDFALYEDVAHANLRRLHKSYIEEINNLYDKIFECEKSLIGIEELLDSQSNCTTCEKVPVDDYQKEKRVNLKEKFSNLLGTFGVVLYFIVRLIISTLPFVMIGGNFFIFLLLTSIHYFLPITSVVFWIWGLVCAIKGVQDIWAITYYVVFVVIWIPFFISTIASIFSKK